MGKSDFIVQSFLRDLSIKRDFILENSSPGNIFNAVLPIGKDKMMTVSPKRVFFEIKKHYNQRIFQV